MPLIIRNKNKFIYRAKSGLREFIYTNPVILVNYLKLKERAVKRRVLFGKEALFQKVFIETISYCNNDCVFCPASTRVGAKKPEDFMPEGLYIKIINELAGISFTGSIAFHCNNEPLLDKRLVSWIRIARKSLKNSFLYLYTNAILMNIKLLNEIFDAGLNRVIINNYDDEHKLIPAIQSLLEKVHLIRGDVIVNYRSESAYLGNRCGESPNAKFLLKAPLRFICLRPLTEIVVGFDGSVPLCCADALWKQVTGNVNSQSLKEIWFSAHLKQIRDSLLNGNRDCTDICKVCDALDFYAPKGINV